MGVLKALFGGKSPATGLQPLDVEVFTGTSVGSFNAALMVSETTGSGNCLEAVEKVEKIWLDRIAEQPEGVNNGAFRLRADFVDYLNLKRLFNHPLEPIQELAEDMVFFAEDTAKRSMNFLTSEGSLGRRGLEALDLASAFSTRPLHDLVVETVDVQKILDPSARALKVVATNWDVGRSVVFRNNTDEKPSGDSYDVQQLTEPTVHPAILASTAIPGIFPAVRFACNGEEPAYYADGGVLMNTPLSPALKVPGVREIHVVYFDPKLEKLPANYLPNTLDTFNRFLFMSVSQLVDEDIEEVRKINRQARVAKTIDPIVKRLARDLELEKRLEQRAADVQNEVKTASAFIERLSRRHEIVVHRHYPSRSLGGILGLLNFKRGRMQELIDLGFEDTVAHDCRKLGCVVLET